jgi:hypothetical protein
VSTGGSISEKHWGSLTLAQRMRLAAVTLEEFNRDHRDLYSIDAHWRPSELRREAEHVDAEEREKADRGGVLVEELARVIFEGIAPSLLWPGGAGSPDTYRQFARSAIDAGWHK